MWASTQAASTCSPYIPSPRLATVIPICAVAMYRSCLRGSRSTLCTSRARRWFCAARRSMAARCAPTMANSAATKTAFNRISTKMMSRGTSTSALSFVFAGLVLVEVRGRHDCGGDRAVLDAFDFDGQLPNFHALARIRQPSRFTRQKFAHGEIVGGPCAFDPQPRAFERQGTGQADAAVREPQRQQTQGLELVRHGAEQLSQHIFEGDE